jgi:uncharacterized damage-inducible protein DinB
MNIYDKPKFPMDAQQLIETWQINNRINLYLLDAIPEEDLADVLASKGRNVGEQFAHIHNVRLMWLKVAIPEALEGLAKIEKGQPSGKAILKDSLTRSGDAINRLLEHAAANGGKVKNFKPHVTAFLGYLIAHDAHHRSQIIIALKQSGQPLDKKVLYGIWEWGTR